MPASGAHVALLSFSLAALLSACGSTVAEPAEPDTATPNQVSPESSGELVAYGMVMQSSPQERIELCANGVMLTSYPPQCSGPELLGEFSWEDVDAEQASGVRWTDGSYFAVGHFDREADTFTLTRPLSPEPPPGFEMPEPDEDAVFPQLCDDPFLGVGEDTTSDESGQERLLVRMEGMHGYVTSWVSDGVSIFNVIVTGDPEAARRELREVWSGGLCVEQRDVPDAASIAAAQQALRDRYDELDLTTTYGGNADGLQVTVLHADEATIALVKETVAPWIEPEHVHVTGSMFPLVSTPSE